MVSGLETECYEGIVTVENTARRSVVGERGRCGRGRPLVVVVRSEDALRHSRTRRAP